MLYPTIAFAGFFAVVFVGSWLLRPSAAVWKLFLLAASYVFYAWWEPWWCLVLLGLTLATQVLSTGVHRSRGTPAARLWLAAAVAVPVTTLAVVKYGPQADLEIVTSADRIVAVLIPVGISYLSFQSVLFVLDVHRGRVRPAKLVDTGLFLAFFPRLLAGPVVRADEFLPQLRRRQDPRHLEAAPAMRLIATGLVKALVISNYLAVELVDPVFAAPADHGALTVLAASLGFLVQLYCDIGGYADLAVGMALLLGLRLRHDMASPLVAGSLQQFWGRWHVTVGRFFRESVFTSLGGERTGGGGAMANVFITFVVMGLWLGDAVTLVLFGAVSGALVVAERAVLGVEGPEGPMGLRRVVGTPVTLLVVSLSFVLLRVGSLDQATELLGRLTDLGGPNDLLTPLLLATLATVVLLQAVPGDVWSGVDTVLSRTPIVVQAVTLAAVLYLVARLGPAEVVPPFQLRF
jgi:D-alanyl-lipoteichoic acid acyltransferase DltB (MBOAT superfamily)